MSRIVFNSTREVVALDGESILDAALRSNLAFPYSCRTGRCSACKCKATAGKTISLREELGLNAAEKSDGYILGCVRTAVGDVGVEVEADLDIAMPPVVLAACRINEIIRLPCDVLIVRLRMPPSTRFKYFPGQYVEVIGPEGLRRSYSIANAPQGSNIIELHIKRVEGGAFSEYWFRHAKPNDLLRLNGPLGTFFLREVAGLDLVFLATGTGFAPVKAILEELEAEPELHSAKSVSVYWGVREVGDFYWDDDQSLFKSVKVLSRPHHDWHGERGYVQDVFLSKAPSLDNAVVFACGSDRMIRAARSLLLTAGLAASRFHSDAFVCSAKNQVSTNH